MQFALGNLFARQGRWPEAQQSYFRAFSAMPENADYAFNLGVGLDRMNQPRLAQTYYRRALELAQREVPDLVVLDLMLPGLDGTEVARRLKADSRTAGVPIVMLVAPAFWGSKYVNLEDSFAPKVSGLDVIVPTLGSPLVTLTLAVAPGRSGW